MSLIVVARYSMLLGMITLNREVGTSILIILDPWTKNGPSIHQGHTGRESITKGVHNATRLERPGFNRSISRLNFYQYDVTDAQHCFTVEDYSVGIGGRTDSRNKGACEYKLVEGSAILKRTALIYYINRVDLVL